MKASLLLLTLVFWWCVQTPAAAQSDETTVPGVVVDTVDSRVIETVDSYIARVEAITTVELQARVTGFLEKRNFVEGGFVKNGELLYQIEKAPYEAAVAKAKAELEGAQATEKNGELYLERQKLLLKQGDVPQATVDVATAELGADRAATNQAKADLQTAQINLGYTDIYSPLDGRIGISAIDVGNVVGPSNGILATINSVDPIYVVFYVSEQALLEERRKGLITGSTSSLKAKVTLADGEAFDQTGTVEYVDIEVQESTDTIELRASFPNPDAVLLPGQFVSVALEDPTAKPVITVPQAAIQLDNKGHFVFVVDEKDTVQRRDVTLGEQIPGAWIVQKGLSVGEQVVVQGLQKIHAGAKVNPVDAATQSDG